LGDLVEVRIGMDDGLTQCVVAQASDVFLAVDAAFGSFGVVAPERIARGLIRD
jgi:hypothetical protein